MRQAGEADQSETKSNTEMAIHKTIEKERSFLWPAFIRWLVARAMTDQHSAFSRPESLASGYPASPPRRWSGNWFLLGRHQSDRCAAEHYSRNFQWHWYCECTDA